MAVKLSLPIGAFAALAAASLGGFALVSGWPGPAPSAATAPLADPQASARLDAVEERLRRLEDTATAHPADQAKARSGGPAPAERFLVGLLHLQNVAASARPWQRELQLVLDLARPTPLAPALTQVLAFHAPRGVPTRAQLRARFAALRPDLLAYAPAEAGVAGRLLQGGQMAAAGLGLAAPVPPGRTEAALASIAEHLARGDLSTALFDAATLDPALQPRIAEWSAQARARLAVEQAIQELLFQSLEAGVGRP
ncbi:hypothetical protein STVA_27670 [Allostella vacuolata]|nr:hypothetical protein STVA_27670 [Stella vacuolata]